MNRKAKFIAYISGIIFVYSCFWYYASIFARDLIINQLHLENDSIISSGYPFKLKYKIKEDKNNTRYKIRSIGLDIFTKNIFLELDDIEMQGGIAGRVESISKLKISGMLESYYSAYKTSHKEKFEDIDILNIFEKVGVNFVIAEDSALGEYLEGDVYISIPSKRQYLSIEDFENDLPRKLNLSLNYKLFSNLENNKNLPSFYSKIYKNLHPEYVNMTLSLDVLKDGLKVQDFRNNPIDALKNIKLTGYSNGDNPMLHSKSDFSILPDKDNHKVKINNISQYKGDSIQTFLESLLKEDYADLVIYSIRRMGIILSDNIKTKIKIFTGAMYERMHAKSEQDPNYWNKWKDFKSEVVVDLTVNHDDPMNGLQYDIKISDSSLKGNLTLKEKEKKAKGILSISDKDSQYSELLVFGRYAMRAFEDSVTPESFEAEVANHQSDVDYIHMKLLEFSDNPEDKSGMINYTFDIDSRLLLQSKISENKILRDVLTPEPKNIQNEEAEE